MSPSTPIAPGVYVKEVPSGTRSITSVGTSIAAFLGFAPTGPLEPTRVKNWREYTGLYRPIPAVFNHENRPEQVVGLVTSDKGVTGDLYLVGKDIQAYKCNFDTGELDGGSPATGVVRNVFTGLDQIDSAGKRSGATANLFTSGSTFCGTGIALIKGVLTGIPAAYEQDWDACSIYAGKYYIFKGSEYIITDSAGTPVGAAERIAEGFPGLPSYFYRDLDGVAVHEGVMYFFKGGETAATVPEAAFLETALSGYFANGGGPCYIARIPTTQPNGTTALTKAQMLDCFKGTSALYEGVGLAGLERVEEVTMVAAPGLWGVPGVTLEDGQLVQQTVVSHCAGAGNRVAVLDPPPKLQPDGVKAYTEGLGLPEEDKPFGTLYYPWLQTAGGGSGGVGRVAPPSGCVTGVWCRTDARRGVHKAPANETVAGVSGVEWALTDEEQGPLNTIGVNCIRGFPGQGVRVWGARTLAALVSTEWKYVNVRRLCSFIQESVRTGTRWAVFEPNDERLRAAIRSNTATFLRDQWRAGALAGKTPDEAFFVVCDATNNPPESIAQGKLICDIGIAPTRPAEFITLRISQIVKTAT
ncbi:phage tail sheath C-terminal domain-containing protein [Streptomyces lavendulae]|uniref:phage tail sheath C-terminal domain-containing protein n=1 Tax=Streptomyces lavendulae TaxID=1914 RepID=UPI0033F98728